MEAKDIRVLTVEEKRLYDYGRKAGIKEVVEWIRSNVIFKYDNDREAWQAKLKGWEIE